MLNVKYLVLRLMYLFVLLPANALAAESVNCHDSRAEMIGRAIDPETGGDLYCEKYYTLDADNWQVVYSVGADIIVEKSLNYAFGLEVPTVLQRDARSGEVRSVTLGQDATQWSVEYQPSAGDERKLATIGRSEDQVIDAGFDYYVRKRWADIVADEAVVFDFISIPHLKSIALRASRVEMKYCADLAVPMSGDGVCIQVMANNRLLRLFVGKLTLLYDKQKRLRVFNGAVNIQNSDARTQTATIVYQYKNEGDN